MDFYEFGLKIDENQFDENFWNQFQQGFKDKYQTAKASTSTKEQDYEKFAAIALPAVAKVKEAATKLSKKYKIPLPLVIALLAAGAAGGFGALPGAAAMYFARKAVMNPIMKGASKAFDAGVNKFQKPAAPQTSQQAMHTGIERGLQDYLAKRKAGAAPGINWDEWIQMQEADWYNQATDWLGKKAGQGAGYLAGKGAKYTGKLKNILSGSFGELKQFVSQNKLALAKAAYMLCVGALIGAGVGWASDKATHAVMDVLRGTPEIPQQELNQLDQEVSSDSWNDELGRHTAHRDGATGQMHHRTPDGQEYVRHHQSLGDKQVYTPTNSHSAISLGGGKELPLPAGVNPDNPQAVIDYVDKLNQARQDMGQAPIDISAWKNTNHPNFSSNAEMAQAMYGDSGSLWDQYAKTNPKIYVSNEFKHMFNLEPGITQQLIQHRVYPEGFMKQYFDTVKAFDASGTYIPPGLFAKAFVKAAEAVGPDQQVPINMLYGYIKQLGGI